MAFVRKRVTKTGVVSSALVEAYRDKGRPRQRVLANLHGAETTLDALAKLAAQRLDLRKEKKRLQPELKAAEEIHSGWMIAVTDRRRFSREERLEINQLLRARKRLLKRAKHVDAKLARIEREGAIIKKHCGASPDEIQAAIKAYQKKLERARAMVLGSEYMLEQAKQELKQLSS